MPDAEEVTVTPVTSGAWVVGQPGRLYVGVEGTVENVGDGLVTISGVTLPTRLRPGAPVRWLSTERPMDHEECEWTDPSEEHHKGFLDGKAEANDQWAVLVRGYHEDRRRGQAWRWCPDLLCERARRFDG